LIERDAVQPGLVISDFNLPNGMDGLCVAAKLRARLRRSVPVIILTGDIRQRHFATSPCKNANISTSRRA